MSKLKPCQQCKSLKYEIVFSNYALPQKVWVLCGRCNRRGEEENSEQEAIQAWNRRVKDERD